jgi:hypothetical protein
MGARRVPLALLVLLVGCATVPQGNGVLLQPPDEGCDSLGPLAVRMSTELLMSEDARLASAVSELRRRAAMRGATHLVVARTSSPASISYGTTAAASGMAYRCPSQG